MEVSWNNTILEADYSNDYSKCLPYINLSVIPSTHTTIIPCLYTFT